MIRGPRPKRLMFSHIVVGANDLSRAIAFYDQLMAALGYAGHDTHLDAWEPR
jgi:hypothetical protein